MTPEQFRRKEIPDMSNPQPKNPSTGAKGEANPSMASPTIMPVPATAALRSTAGTGAKLISPNGIAWRVG